eukprot:m.4064 g.4064  ORF g.4064 m.4064 type:complete len:80 (-) comp6681_c0_seq2:1397-1636(-)
MKYRPSTNSIVISLTITMALEKVSFVQSAISVYISSAKLYNRSLTWIKWFICEELILTCRLDGAGTAGSKANQTASELY